RDRDPELLARVAEVARQLYLAVLRQPHRRRAPGAAVGAGRVARHRVVAGGEVRHSHGPVGPGCDRAVARPIAGVALGPDSGRRGRRHRARAGAALAALARGIRHHDADGVALAVAVACLRRAGEPGRLERAAVDAVTHGELAAIARG